MLVYHVLVYFLFIIIKECVCVINWGSIRCSPDADQNVPEGIVQDIARFPWLGFVQHYFNVGGKTRFAVTSGVLIHPGYAIASADDISRILPERIENNTKFIVWKNKKKHALNVQEYYLHPEFSEDVTYASLALLQMRIRVPASGYSDPVLPVCMPVRGGAGSLSDLYAVQVGDDKGELCKSATKMELVNKSDCEDFYRKSKLDHKKMTPVSPICAASVAQTHTCVWEDGVALVAKIGWGHWVLLGFGVRGPGCGAPARFIYIPHYIPWFDAVISRSFTRRRGGHTVVLTQVSPFEFTMYDVTKTKVPTDVGQCDRKTRGHVVYKDNSEILVNKNFAQGFFFVSIMQLVDVRCAVVNLEVASRSNAAVWHDHHCVQDYTGDRVGEFPKGVPKKGLPKDDRARSCFIYFKTESYIEFRFYFSFRAIIEVTMFGQDYSERMTPNPYPLTQYTTSWMPTYDKLKAENYMPLYVWMYHM